MNNTAQKRKPVSQRVFGVDIGATNCRVSTWSTKLGKPERVVDELKNRSIPSNVVETDTGVLVGYQALGLTSKDLDTLFTAVRDTQENPKGKRIEVEINANVLTHLLAKLRDIVMGHFGKEAIAAVLSVPMGLSDTGRQAVRDACSEIGLNPLRIMNDATCACIAYDLGNKVPNEETTVVVFDMGGSSFNISIVLIEDGIFDVIHTARHTDVSGNRFDERLADSLIIEYDRKNKSYLHDNAQIMRRMRAACCKAKECLSSASYTSIFIENIQNDRDYKYSVTKAYFEKVSHDLFKSAIDMVKGALNEAHVRNEDVHFVTMAGGSSKIPKLNEMVLDMFPGRVIGKAIDPEDVTSFGCVTQAMLLAGLSHQHEKLEDLLLLDVEPLSLGLETAENVMAVLIPRNATIPCKRSMTFTTYHDNQVTMIFRVFEGERRFTRDNTELGMFEMTGIRAEPRGRARIDVTFDIDATGVLTITTTNRFSRKSQSCTLTNFKSYYDQGELEDIIEIAEDTKDIDDKEVAVMTSKLFLVSFIANMDSAMEQENGINDTIKETVMTKCREIKEWITNQESIEQSVYEKKMSVLENEICSHGYLNRDLVTRCKNDKLQFISGRIVEKVVTKPQGLSTGWRKGRTGRSTSSTPVISVPTNFSAPAVDVKIDEVD